ncbi:MAG: T9SS type A sorting domain-containing protein [Chitinophagales bacterium]|nr:T9SS type A sorting domain-containing protein [Bacteroidota bacterium]MBP7400058.1 T9SS type A sorting domain-containing protein [Chitinophagales bacterium]MBK8680635.1 T9SS type A sorting domain-containing protein [Bacteroidota bacterium]MBP8754038.1 T9SS type A sorting domain-containing protein [Chitinophagales bacterium]MBP9189100.1 T9SS type A sorting domain-containing protein [Chitinophagales bacterium]
MKKKITNLNTMLIGYSALSVSFLLIAQKSDAQIIYTDIDPDEMLLPYYDDGFDMDINGDGTNDFHFQVYSWGFTAYAGYEYFAAIQPLGSNAAGYILDSSFRECSSYLNVQKVAPVLNAEDTISADMQFANEEIIFASVSQDDYPCYGSGQMLGSWVNKSEKFCAIKFKIDSEYHYGWIRMSMNEFYEITIHDYAYESLPDVPIIAGRTTGTIAEATGKVSDVLLSDISDNLNVTDLQVNFTKAEEESAIDAYHVFISPTNESAYFTTEFALALPEDRFTSILPTGENITANFTEDVKDIFGFDIVPGVIYYAGVLSYNHFATYPMSVSDVSNGVELNLPVSIQSLQSSANIYYADAQLHVHSYDLFRDTNLSIYDIAGKKVFTKTITQKDELIDINIPTGIYTITMQSPTNFISGKLFCGK